MDQRNMNGKGLMVSISEEPRSISPSPQPGSNMGMIMPQQHQHQPGSYSMNSMIGGHLGSTSAAMEGDIVGDDSPYVQEQDDDSGEGEVSQFGRAKKPKRKAAPRTSRACLACRRQKMRCEGADNPPCRRCISNEVDCMFERRSDYLLNPEDRAWQNGVEKRLEHLSRTIDMMLAHLSGGQSMPPPPNTAAPSFPEMPPAAPYYESYERQPMPPNTAPPGTAGDMGNMNMMSGGGRVNYVVPSPAETAAIAAQAQARARRSRGNTLPNLPSASFPPDSSGFHLFSPRTGGGLDSGVPNPSTYGAPTPGAPPSAHPHHGHHGQHHLHQGELGPHHGHPHPHGGPGGQGQYAHTPSHAYSFNTYPGGEGHGVEVGVGGPGSHGHGSFSIENDGSYNGGDPRDHHHQQHQAQMHHQQQQLEAQAAGAVPGNASNGGGADLVPRSLSSPNVRFAHHQSMTRDDLHGNELGAAPLQGAEGTA